jgi:hypothetical protein
MLTQQNMIGALLYSVPEFEPLYQGHILLYQERLDHVLFGELFTFTKAAFEAGNVELVGRVIQFINQVALSSDDDLLDPLHTSFIEYLPRTDLSSRAFEQSVVAQLNIAALGLYQQVVEWLAAQAPALAES